MTGAEGRGCARCKRQPAHAAVHTMQACTGARHAPMAAVHRRQKAYVRRGGGMRGRGGLRCKRQPAHAVVELNAHHVAALRRGVRSCGG